MTLVRVKYPTTGIRRIVTGKYYIYENRAASVIHQPPTSFRGIVHKVNICQNWLAVILIKHPAAQFQGRIAGESNICKCGAAATVPHASTSRHMSTGIQIGIATGDGYAIQNGGVANAAARNDMESILSASWFVEGDAAVVISVQIAAQYRGV